MKQWSIGVALAGLFVGMTAAPPSQAVGSLADLQKEFPYLVFADEFNQQADGEYPDGWQAMAILGQPNAQVEHGAFRILTGVNIHLIQPLVLDDFLLKYRVRGEKRQPNKLFCHMPCFRMGPDHTGYTVFHQFGRCPALLAPRWKAREGDRSFRCTLHDLAYGAFDDARLVNRAPLAGMPLEKLSEAAGRDAYDTTAWHDMAVAARSNQFSVFQDGVLVGVFEDKTNRYPKGRIGFTMAGSGAVQPGAMYLDDVQVYGKQPVREEIITDLKGIEIPWKYNRLASGLPMLYDAQVARYGSGYVLRGSVRGGACHPGLPQVMRNPYVKLETLDGRHATTLYLYRGTVGRTEIEHAIAPPPFGPTDTSGPQQAQCYFDYDPGKHRISVGYEYYVSYRGATLAGPCEVVVDATTGKVVHEGPPLKDGAVLTMSSPPEKKVLERVSPTNSFYAGFKEFLADNHFFVAGEKVAFRADLLQARLDPASSCRAEFRVKDAFKDRVLKTLTRELSPDRSEAGVRRAAAGLHPLWTDWVDLGKLDPGVYHLEITARDSDGAIKGSVIKAFSVLPAKVDLERTPAERSGLPLMTGDNLDVMQPASQADAYHYSCLTAGVGGDMLDGAELQYALNKRVIPAVADKVRKNFLFATGFTSLTFPDEYARVPGPGFFKKSVVMTALCPAYWKEKRCHWAWANQYRLCSLQPPQINEMIEGFKLVNRNAPERPVPTVAYVDAQEWIARHLEMHPDNPADESLAFACEEACRAGVPGGFFADAADLENLEWSLVNTLVLPPLKYADQQARQAIRKWHARGVNLVGFEDVTGLEDLFGVRRLATPAACAAVQVADNALAKALLDDVLERQILLTGNFKTMPYGLAGGQAILECADAGGTTIGPALVLNRGPQASTLLWTVAPTDIARVRGECASELVRLSMGRGLREVADTPVTTTAGNLLAYWGQDGKLRVIVSENAFPFPSLPIHPLVKIRIKGIGKYRIESEKIYTTGLHNADEISFSFDLVENELAVFALARSGR